MDIKSYIQQVLENVKNRVYNEPEFLQIVEEILGSLESVLKKHPEYYAEIINSDLLMLYYVF